MANKTPDRSGKQVALLLLLSALSAKQLLDDLKPKSGHETSPIGPHHRRDRVQSPMNSLQVVAETTGFPPIPILPFNNRTLES